jgi:hypothetical protein
MYIAHIGFTKVIGCKKRFFDIKLACIMVGFHLRDGDPQKHDWDVDHKKWLQTC